MVSGDPQVELIEYDDTPQMLGRLRSALAKYTAGARGYPRRTPA